MRWPVTLIVTYVLLGLELSIKRRLAIGDSHVAPSFLVPMVVFIALSAPPLASMWFALALGAAVDLLSARGTGHVVVLGPYALGYLAAAYLVLTMRGVMFRRNPVSVVFLSVVGAGIAEIVVVAVLSLRSLYPRAGPWDAWAELGERLLSAAYTGVTGAVLAVVLLPMAGLFRFHDPHGRRFARRGG